jgi:hypothetical protein
MINFVYSLNRSDGGLDEIDLTEDEIEEILNEMPTNPEFELRYMD